MSEKIKERVTDFVRERIRDETKKAVLDVAKSKIKDLEDRGFEHDGARRAVNDGLCDAGDEGV